MAPTCIISKNAYRKWRKTAPYYKDKGAKIDYVFRLPNVRLPDELHFFATLKLTVEIFSRAFFNSCVADRTERLTQLFRRVATLEATL